MNEEALTIIGELYVELNRLRKITANYQEALKMKTQECEALVGEKNEEQPSL